MKRRRPLFPDLLQGEVERDKALERVQLANQDWVDHAINTIRFLSRHNDTFTTDDVWAKVAFKPHEPRAMGAAMRAASQAGIISPTGVYQKSHRTACHARPVMVWKSECC